MSSPEYTNKIRTIFILTLEIKIFTIINFQLKMISTDKAERWAFIILQIHKLFIYVYNIYYAYN